MKEYSDRCHRCDQPKSTHDDGECAGVQRSMEQPAKAKRESALDAFKREGEPNGGKHA